MYIAIFTVVFLIYSYIVYALGHIRGGVYVIKAIDRRLEERE